MTLKYPNLIPDGKDSIKVEKIDCPSCHGMKMRSGKICERCQGNGDVGSYEVPNQDFPGNKEDKGDQIHRK